MKELAPDVEIAYNSGVQTRYTQRLAAANSWNALGVGLTNSLADPGGFESMTYILYRVLRAYATTGAGGAAGGVDDGPGSGVSSGSGMPCH